MPKTFVITRSGTRRLMICRGVYRAEHLEDDPKSLKRCLGLLGENQNSPAQLKSLREALERFYRFEARSLAKFGQPKLFRIWRVDGKTLQIDFKGGYAELTGKTTSDAKLQQSLEAMGANQLLLADFRRELAEFRREEQKSG